jgi:hypothetical protein
VDDAGELGKVLTKAFSLLGLFTAVQGCNIVLWIKSVWEGLS